MYANADDLVDKVYFPRKITSQSMAERHMPAHCANIHTSSGSEKCSANGLENG